MLILASTSKYRKAQLEGLGLRFRQEAPGVDEDAVSAEGFAPPDLASALAERKAMAVLGRAQSGDLVLAGDQLVEFEGVVLGKPGTAERAVAQLVRMAGGTHTLWTAVCLVEAGSNGRVWYHLDRTELTMRALSEDALARYVALDNPVDCAGSYKLEAGGASLFSAVATRDPTAITGLPLLAVVRMLDEAGFDVP